MILSIRDVSVKYGKKQVLDHITCMVGQGVTGLLGDNGSGKSTLLRMITGVEKPTEGSIYLDELAPGCKEFRNILGYLPQDNPMYNLYSGWDYLKYVSCLKGIASKETDERIEDYLVRLNLWNDRKKKISQYSGGMRHRLGIIQAMLNSPKLLVLDEPTTGLDFSEKRSFYHMVETEFSDSIVILCTHDFDDVECLCRHIIMLKEGKILSDCDYEYRGQSLRECYEDGMFEFKTDQI